MAENTENILKKILSDDAGYFNKYITCFISVSNVDIHISQIDFLVFGLVTMFLKTYESQITLSRVQEITVLSSNNYFDIYIVRTATSSYLLKCLKI